MLKSAGSSPEKANVLEMHQDMLSRALRLYWKNLGSSLKARRYIKERGLTAESVRRFGLGYAGDAHGLRAVFPNYQVQALVDCGLVIDGARGRFDRFRDRLMFPILNEQGRVIGFGGRIFDGEGAKYLNSPQSELFDKGACLFGLPQARASMETTGEAIVVEGYMDVVMASQHGVENVVAALGTATTEKHLTKLIATGVRRIVFCFDGDEAGHKAAVAAMKVCVGFIKASGPEIAFAFLPEGEDPDSLVQKRGADEFKIFIAQAIPFEDFLLSYLREGRDMATCEGRAHMATEALEILDGTNDAGFFYRFCDHVARETDFSVVELIGLSNPRQREWSTPRDVSQSPAAVAPNLGESTVQEVAAVC